MNDNRQQLKYVLQMMALPVTGQTHLMANDCCRLDEISQGFDHWYHALQDEWPQRLTLEQTAVLTRLDEKLAQMRQNQHSPFWSEMTIRQSADWRLLRQLARLALVEFKWPLELPPQNASFYQQEQGVKFHDQRSGFQSTDCLSYQWSGNIKPEMECLS